MSDEASEILRLRARLHTLSGTAGELTMRLLLVERKLERLEPLVEDLIAHDRIKEAVEAALEEKHTLRLTTVQKVVAILGVLGAMVAPYVTPYLGH